MHPLNKLAFGNTAGSSIKVRYHNGSSVVTGYIVKQVSATKWVVTTNGTTKFTVKLAKNGTPVAGQFTIQANKVNSGVANGSTEHVTKIDGHHISTSEGNRYMWTIASALPTAAGYAKLEVN